MSFLLNKKTNHSQNKRWMFVILGLLIMVMIGTVYSYGVFRVAIEPIFNITTSISGYPYMVALASYAIFMLLSGPYVQRFHPRMMLLSGGFLVSLGWVLSSMTSNINQFILTYGFISGAGVGIMYGVPMAVVARWFPDKKGLAVGCVIVGFGLSPLITAPLANLLIQSFGVMQAFLVLGISLLLILPLLILPFRFPNQEEIEVYKSKTLQNDNQVSMDVKAMIRTLSFKGLYLNFVLGTMIGLTLIGLTANIGLRYVGLNVNQVSQWMAVFALFNGGGRPLFGWITDRLSISKAMLISFGLILSASLLMILFGQQHPIVFIGSFIIFWFNLGGWLAIAPTSTMKLYGIKHYSQNYGVVFTAYGLGAILGVLASGYLLDTFNQVNLVFWFVIGCCVLGVVNTILSIKS
jgi:OFA family oxalate/formate antiporter-like MFS transporter